MVLKLRNPTDEELKKMDLLVEEFKFHLADLQEFLDRNDLTEEEEDEKDEIEETMEESLEELFEIMKQFKKPPANAEAVLKWAEKFYA